LRLCGGIERCTAGQLSEGELRWLTAIRAVYAGVVLTRSLAAQWGGSLLRLARQAAEGGPAPSTLVLLAAEHADPMGAQSGTVAAGLAVAYLQHGDLERLSELSRGLREARAPWLVGLCETGVRAAVTSPLEPERFALLAPLCDACADPTAGLDGLCADVETYDAAVHCPRCGSSSAHPLPGVRLGAPHPVGRCVAGSGPAARACLAHDGGELDPEGLCAEGRALLDRAVLEAAKIGRASTPYERDLVHALVRARRRALDADIDDAAVARALVTSPALMPFFAALAATDANAAEDLAQIAGAPLNPEAADPGVRAAMSGGAGLERILAAGKAALEGLRDSILGKAARPALPRLARKHRRHRRSKR
jgi:hypothetical protein